MLDDSVNQGVDQVGVSTMYPSASKTEQIQGLVNTLVSSYQQVEMVKPGRGSKSTRLEHDIPGHDLGLYESWLAEAHHHFRDASQQKAPLTYASEWVLDNYYIIRQALKQIEEDLPNSFYKQLPRLIGGPMKGFPRIYAVAREILSYQHLLIDPVELQTILILYQKQVPLTMGELWALPIFLRYGLIEFLAQELIFTIHPSKLPNLPGLIPELLEGSGQFPASDAVAGASVNNDGISNIILSLRSISELDWSDFFESVSVLEQTLIKDPAGIYSQMDFKTSDMYRKEIEVLSLATGRDENEVAEIALDLARAAEKRNTSSGYHEVHIGDILLGKGRDALEHQIGYQPDSKTTFRRWVFKHASGFYLSSILVMTILILIPITFAAHLPEILGATPLSFGDGPWSFHRGADNVALQWIVILLLGAALSVPVLSVATSLVNWLITLMIRPRVLPKLDFENKIPEQYQTLVVIPAMITSRKEIESLARQLELHYLRNPEPGLFFALLTDFCDADVQSLPEDECLVQQTIAEIEALNRKYQTPASSLDHSASLFYFLNRNRLWNPSEKKWIGWERKRGKLHELNQFLRGETNLSFTTITDGISTPRASSDALQQIRYVITLDSDTILPRGAACRLVGTLAHPLNQAVFDEKSGRVISGYTVLQPRMEIHPKSTNRSWFTRFFAGDAGLDLYSLAVSDAYQDLFQEGIYVGKGIYDVDAFMRSVDNHIPDNTVLSHDLLEGLMGRAGLVTDITMIEDYPQNYIIQALRQRRWIRGDWQLLPWLLSSWKVWRGLTID